MAKFYITTAIVYANAAPHIGFAYEVIASDTLARFKRFQGHDVKFVSGMDEHSANVEKKAKSLGLEPQVYCDQVSETYKKLFYQYGISNDVFIRTTEPRHHKAAQAMVEAVNKKGDVYKGHYEGWYCSSCEAFYQEKDLKGKDCPVHQRPTEWLKEDNYFFALSKYGEELRKYIESHPEFIQPSSRRNEVLRVIEGGLQDISISRSTFKWGIPFPLEASHVIYVWFDALVNYLSAIGYPEEGYKAYWPADVHIVGKDITRFHCVIWPAMLMSAGIPLPKQVYGHGFLNIGGEKISKSRGNVVDPVAFGEKYGVDVVRYFLLREIVWGEDGDFSEEALVSRRNSDLADDLGNLVSRVLSMVDRYCAGKMPTLGMKCAEDDEALQRKAEEVWGKFAKLLEAMNFSGSLAKIWELVRMANQYVDKQAPWKLSKDLSMKGRLDTVLNQSSEAVVAVATMIAPFMPSTAESILAQAGLDPVVVLVPDLYTKPLVWPRLKGGESVKKSPPMFPKESNQ